jgi:basic membrane lipoprotein Med (substrate-binding protein (PBP1-ABC) superfamily)
MNKRIIGAVAAAAALAVAAVTFHASAADKLKVGFIGVGPIGDLGWTFQHDVGRQAMVKALGDKVDTTIRHEDYTQARRRSGPGITARP